MENAVCFAEGSALFSTRQLVLRKGLDVVCRRPALVPSANPRRRPPVSMGLFGLGVPEIAVIAGVGIFVFGPSKIAEMGKELGGFAGGVKKATAEFKEAMEESLEEADREIELRKIEKGAPGNKTVDTSAKVVEEVGGAE